MITAFNLFTSISWILAGVISAIISALFYMKNPKKRLNQLFSSGFMFWSLSLIFNGLSFSIAYSSLLAANISRDFCVITGILSAITLFVAAIGIYFGVESLHWFLYLFSLIIAIVLMGIGTVNDWIIVDDLGGYKTTDNLIGKMCIQILPIKLSVVL